MKRDPRLTKTAKQIAVTLVDDFAHHASGRCNPFIATLCEATGDHERTVQRALAQLEACGWITRSKGQGRGRPSAIIFTADPGAGAIIPENVTELAPRRAERMQPTAPDSGPERVTGMAPIPVQAAGERVTRVAQRGDTGGGSHREPRENQKARERAGVSAEARARDEPEKPVLNLGSVAHLGSNREVLWNEWLTRNGWPTLAELGVKSRDVGGNGWEIPFKEPPGDDPIEQYTTVRYLKWAAFHMEARLAETG